MFIRCGKVDIGSIKKVLSTMRRDSLKNSDDLFGLRKNIFLFFPIKQKGQFSIKNKF